MTRATLTALICCGAILFSATAFLIRLHSNRAQCQAIYGANPWTGEAHANVPWFCRTPAENRRIHEVERGPHESYGATP